MKCVCPMGGDRTCPDDCPLAVWANLSPTDRKAQRKPIAEKLYKQGFIMEVIATQLGVTKATISNDLANCLTTKQLKPVKSATNPKGAGRPKGSKKPPQVQAKHDRIVTLFDAGIERGHIASDVGVGQRMVDRVLEVENARREKSPIPLVDWNTIPATAQQKIQAEINRHKRKLDAEFETRCRDDCRRWLDEVGLPHYAKQLAQLERSIRSRDGIMDRITYRKILACLHPDRISDAMLKKRFEEAFRLFTELEKRVLDEKESPTQFRQMPRTYEELMAAKARVQAERRAKRAAKSNIGVR